MIYTPDQIENIIAPTSKTIDQDYSYCNWRRLNLVCFDFETTTAKPIQNDCLPVQYYGQGIIGDKNHGRPVTSLINPEIPIPAESSYIHKIFDADVKDSPRLDEVLPQIVEHFVQADVLVAYNGLSFDLPLAVRLMASFGYDVTQLPPMIDPIVWFRHINGKYSASKQSDAAAYYKIFDLLGNVAHGDSFLHNAETDVKMLIAIVQKMMGGDLPWNLGRVLDIQRDLFLQQCLHRTKQYDEPPFEELMITLCNACNGVPDE